MKPCDLFIFAGEASGDLHGKHLLQELYALNPLLNIAGVGGPQMRTLPFDCFMPTENLQVMGFTDVFMALPRLVRYFYSIRDYILQANPKAVIFIDYPGFNLRLAKSLRKKGFKNKLVHYIAPTVWAWGKKRIPQMAKTLDLLLTIFPFENEYFKETHLPVTYVGNPLVAQLEKHTYHDNWQKDFHLPKRFFALFPGSRPADIQRNLPLQLRAAKEIGDLPFVISCANPSFEPLIREIAQDVPLIPETHTYDLMKDAAFAISKSGTATLELALHGCPTVVTYQLSRLNYFIAKYLFKINLPHYCIANILLNETLFPEMIGLHLDATAIAGHARELNRQETELAKLKLKTNLTAENASFNAAKAIFELL